MEPISRSLANKNAHVMASGSGPIMIGGLAVIVMSVIGLTGIAPHYLLTASVITLGVTLLFEGCFGTAEYSKILEGAAVQSDGITNFEAGGRLSGVALAGVAAIALGILALQYVAPHILAPSAAIVLGIGFIFGRGMLQRLNELELGNRPPRSTPRRLGSEFTPNSTSQVLIGLCAMTLGILALLDIVPQILVFVSMLALGSWFLLSGGIVTGRALILGARR